MKRFYVRFLIFVRNLFGKKKPINKNLKFVIFDNNKDDFLREIDESLANLQKSEDSSNIIIW